MLGVAERAIAWDVVARCVPDLFFGRGCPTRVYFRVAVVRVGHSFTGWGLGCGFHADKGGVKSLDRGFPWSMVETVREVSTNPLYSNPVRA